MFCLWACLRLTSTLGWASTSEKPSTTPSRTCSLTPETVTAVVSGLYPSERSALARTPGVEVVQTPNDGHPARQRLRDFQSVIEGWPDHTPVAYWDAGDVVFQGALGPLWDEVRTYPDHLHVASEIIPFDVSTVARWWAETIEDPAERRHVVGLFMDHSILNSGFAAGTVRAMMRYLKGADKLLRSRSLRGSTDWGDQTAMNLFCHSNPDAWREVSMAWNYCLVGLGPREFRMSDDGRIVRLDSETQPNVVHGNGQTLRQWDLQHLTL